MQRGANKEIGTKNTVNMNKEEEKQKGGNATLIEEHREHAYTLEEEEILKPTKKNYFRKNNPTLQCYHVLQ